jgi:hypothetical protein
MSFKKNIAKLTEKKSVSSIFFPVLLVSLVGIIHTKPSIAESITPEPDPGNTDTIVTHLENRFHIVVDIPGTSLVRLSQPGSSLSIEIQPITPASSQVNPRRLPVLSLAQLVTGGGGSHATRLIVTPDGKVHLTGSGIYVKNGDLVTKAINALVSPIATLPPLKNAGSIPISAENIVKDITSGNYQISSIPAFTLPSPISTQGNLEMITLP